MKLIVAAPIVALALAGAGTGAYFLATSGGGEEEAVVVQPTPTAQPSPSATAVPTVTDTPAPQPTPEAGKAPDGCLESEKAYVDPDGRFAFCYPGDMELATVDTDGDAAAAHVTYSTEQPNWVSVSFGIVVEPYELCGFDSPTIVKKQRIAELIVSGQTVQACYKDHYDPSNPDSLLYKSIEFEMKMGGKPLFVLAGYSGPDFQRGGVPLEEVVMRVLDSTLVY